MYILGIHFRVPQRLLPIHASIQVIVVFLWMYSIILTTGYSSNLTAFLTVHRQPPSIETIRELRESDLKVFGVGPFFGNSMAQSENPHLRVRSPLVPPFFSVGFPFFLVIGSSLIRSWTRFCFKETLELFCCI